MVQLSLFSLVLNHEKASTKCENSVGSFKCECIAGFTKVGVNDHTCIDIDECTTKDLKLRHSCVANSKCTNELGSYRCDCNDGYEGDAKKSCDSVDECTTGTHNCHELSTTCKNLDGNAGGYECTCKPGFEKDSNNDFACKDVDECNPTDAIGAIDYDLIPCNIMSGSCLNTQVGFQTAPWKCDSTNSNYISYEHHLVRICLKTFPREATFVSATMDLNLAQSRIRKLTSIKIASTLMNVLKRKDSLKIII